MAHPLFSLYFAPKADDSSNPNREPRGTHVERAAALASLDDHTLVLRIRDGDTDALATLMHHVADQLVRIAEITTRSRDAAYDAVQDVFVELWQGRARLDPNRNLRAYLRRAVRHRALDAVRHERTERRVTRVTLSESTIDNGGETAIDSAEFREHVHAVLASLPPRCREIFLLHREAGLSYLEIETLLGISNATIRNQVSRAVRALTDAIARGVFADWGM